MAEAECSCKGKGTHCQPFEPTTPEEFISACSGKNWAGCGQDTQCDKCEFCEDCTDCTNCDKCKDTIYVYLKQNIDFQGAKTTDLKENIDHELFKRDQSCTSATKIILYSDNTKSEQDEGISLKYDSGEAKSDNGDGEKKNPAINGLRVALGSSGAPVFFLGDSSFATVTLYDVDFTNCILDASSSSSCYLYNSNSSGIKFVAKRCKFSFRVQMPTDKNFYDAYYTTNSDSYSRLDHCSEYVELIGQTESKSSFFGIRRVKCTSEFWGTRCGLKYVSGSGSGHGLIANADHCAFRIHCREKQADCSDHGTISSHKGIGDNCSTCVFALSKDCYHENEKEAEATAVEEGQGQAVCTLYNNGGNTRGTCLFDKTLAGGTCTCTNCSTFYNLATSEMTDKDSLKIKYTQGALYP